MSISHRKRIARDIADRGRREDDARCHCDIVNRIYDRVAEGLICWLGYLASKWDCLVYVVVEDNNVAIWGDSGIVLVARELEVLANRTQQFLPQFR